MVFLYQSGFLNIFRRGFSSSDKINYFIKIFRISVITTITFSKKQVVFAVSISLFNPHAIMDTIGVIGTSFVSYTGTEKLAFTTVSWIWFFSLALIGRQVGRLNHSGRMINILNKVSAFIMWGTALYLIFTI